MKKYLTVTIPLNIIYSFLISKILMGYMNTSITNNYSSNIDLLVLFIIVFIVTLFNGILFKLMKVKGKKIYVSLPSIVFMLLTSILLLINK